MDSFSDRSNSLDLKTHNPTRFGGSKDVVWVFGRGASVACNLLWTEPAEWRNYERSVRVAKIKITLLDAIDQPRVNTRPYKSLLAQLAQRTSVGWHHRFCTTNWDTLIEREINLLGLTMCPKWLPETHVFHLNGAVEDLPKSKGIPGRSVFLLPDDDTPQRPPSREYNQAVEWMFARHVFVVVGLSFRCPTDRRLLAVLRCVELCPNFAWWLVINPSPESAEEIKYVLPDATVCYVASGFEGWLMKGMPELVKANILQPSTTDKRE